MTEPDDDLLGALRQMAVELDAHAPAITADDVRSRTLGGSRRPRRGLAAVAAVLVVLMGASAWALMDEDDEQTTVVGPGPEEPAPTTDSPSSTEASSADPPEADWFDWDAMPMEGVAILELDGTLTLYDLVGEGLASGPFTGGLNEPALWVQPGMIQPASDGMAEVPPGCASAATAGGTRVARCGDPDTPRSLLVVDSAGRSRTLIDGAPWPPTGTDPVLGHWRRAIPSPDGRWIVAQWSGECEVPAAVLIDAATGDVRSVAEPVADMRPSSLALGWAADGRAVIELPQSECGSTAGEPGIHLLDPETGVLERILPAPDAPAQVFHWTKRAYGNDAERLMNAAIDQLGLEGCCGEPSHGGPGVTSGAVFEGQDIGISGFPDEVAVDPRLTGEPQRVPFLHGEAVVSSIAGGGSYPGDRVVGFRCGGFTWRLSWWDDSPAEVDSMLLLGEALVPHLGCTLADPTET